MNPVEWLPEDFWDEPEKEPEKLIAWDFTEPIGIGEPGVFFGLDRPFDTNKNPCGEIVLDTPKPTCLLPVTVTEEDKAHMAAQGIGMESVPLARQKGSKDEPTT